MKLNKQRLMEVAGIQLKESSFTKVTKDMWSKMSDDQQADALLSAVKDPDEAESLIGSEWEALPSQVTSNMHVYNGGLNEAAVKEDYSTMSLKSNIDQKWQTADDMAGDMQQWLSSVYATGALEGYEEIMNVLQNLVDNFDPEDEM